MARGGEEQALRVALEAARRALRAGAALTEEKAITVKLFGKVKIYLADQSQFEVNT